MKALLVMDVQNDFLPGGALAVADGDAVIPVINRLQTAYELVVATQDWHPPDHTSFAANHPGHRPGEVIQWAGLTQILWPVHCVQDTSGAAFAAALDMGRWARVFRKGTNRDLDSYSGFFDNGHRQSTGLGDYLKARKVEEVVLAGLTTDYCVKYSALDARRLGFRASLILEACRGVNLRPGDVDRALEELRGAGVTMVSCPV